MWIVTTFGLFSVMQEEGAGNPTVGALVRADLDQLRDRYLPGLSVIEVTQGRDRGYRATVSRQELSDAITKIVADITYDNLEAEVMREQSHVPARVYAEVWATLDNGLSPLDQDSTAQANLRLAQGGGEANAPAVRPIHATTSSGAHCVLLDPNQHSATAIADAMAANAPGDVQVLLDPSRQTCEEMAAAMNAIRNAARKKAGLTDNQD
jgi:hypothetical protein